MAVFLLQIALRPHVAFRRSNLLQARSVVSGRPRVSKQDSATKDDLSLDAISVVDAALRDIRTWERERRTG